MEVYYFSILNDSLNIILLIRIKILHLIGLTGSWHSKVMSSCVKLMKSLSLIGSI